MEEEIRIIEGTNGMYGVSNLGNVYSFFNREPRKLACGVCNNGYRSFIMIMPDGSRNGKTVHRLVAQAFIQNPDNLPCVNHKNEIKTDNRIENLEWCTQKYNVNYGTHNEKISASMKGKGAGKKNNRYRLVCPLVLYTMVCIQHKTEAEIKRELCIGQKCFHRKLLEYNIPYKRKAEH